MFKNKRNLPDNKVIDLIIEQDNTFYPIEIKKSGSPKQDTIKHFGVLEKTGRQVGTGNVICFCSDVMPIDKKNYFVSVWVI